MTNRDLATLAFRLLAVWMIAVGIYAAAGVPAVFEPRLSELRGSAVMAALLPAIVYAGIGGLVWLKSASLSAGTFPEPPLAAGDGLRGEKVLALAVTVIGLLLAVEALPGVVSGVSLFTLSRQGQHSVLGSISYGSREQELLWSAAAKANLAGNVVRLVLGLGMLLGPQKLTAAYLRMRGELRGTLVDSGPPPEDAAGGPLANP